jgi:hypothetical protein
MNVPCPHMLLQQRGCEVVGVVFVNTVELGSLQRSDMHSTRFQGACPRASTQWLQS